MTCSTKGTLTPLACSLGTPAGLSQLLWLLTTVTVRYSRYPEPIPPGWNLVSLDQHLPSCACPQSVLTATGLYFYEFNLFSSRSICLSVPGFFHLKEGLQVHSHGCK